MLDPKINLAAEICALMQRHRATSVEGISALVFALIVSLVDDGMSKQKALETFGQSWDRIAPTMEAALRRGRGHLDA